VTWVLVTWVLEDLMVAVLTFRIFEASSQSKPFFLC
jgi:hypothetical protein